MATKRPTIRARERDSVIQSLKAGVAPRTGIKHIQVGRLNEIEAICKDIDRISQGRVSVSFDNRRIRFREDLFPERDKIHRTRKKARNRERRPLTR